MSLTLYLKVLYSLLWSQTTAKLVMLFGAEAVAVDWSLNIGTILQLLMMLIGGLSIVFSIRAEIKMLAMRLSIVEKQVDNADQKLDRIFEGRR